MNVADKEQLEEIARMNRLKQLAAEEATKGPRSFLKVMWGLAIAAGFVPFLGVFAIGVISVVSFFTCIYIAAKGNISGAVKSFAIGMGVMLLSVGIWFVVNLAFFAISG